MLPPDGQPPVRPGRPALHVYDPHEPHAHLCVALRDALADAARQGRDGGSRVLAHDRGHAVPTDAAAVEAVVAFIRAQIDGAPTDSAPTDSAPTDSAPTDDATADGVQGMHAPLNRPPSPRSSSSSSYELVPADLAESE